MATIYDIAEYCQVSASTVSRAFSRPELVRSEVRDRIMEAAATLGYRANRSARRLAAGSSGLVAVVVPDLTNMFFPPIVRAIEHELRAQDASVLLVDTANTPQREITAIEQFRSEVDGIVMLSPQSLLRDIDTALSGTRAVLVNRPSRQIPSVTCEEGPAFREVFTQFAELGHRATAFVAGPSMSWMSTRRASLAESAASELGLDFEILGPVPATVDAGPRAARLLQESAATAAVVFDDAIAFGALGQLRAAGVDVPGEISLVGCDNLALSALASPSITSIGSDPGRIAHAATTLLDEASPGSLRAPRKAVRSALVSRESVGPAPR